MIEFPRVRDGIASVAFVEAIESASSSDQMAEEDDDWRALSRGRANMRSGMPVSARESCYRLIGAGRIRWNRPRMVLGDSILSTCSSVSASSQRAFLHNGATQTSSLIKIPRDIMSLSIASTRKIQVRGRPNLSSDLINTTASLHNSIHLRSLIDNCLMGTRKLTTDMASRLSENAG